MIDYSKLEINYQTVSEIVNIGNSCGVITCYLLSLIFKFNFDISEFMDISSGFTDMHIWKYAEKNGVNHLKDFDNKINIASLDFDNLCKNDIVMTLSGRNTSIGKPHNSIISFFKGNDFEQLFCNHNDCITKFSEVKDPILTFYFKNIN